MIERIVMCFIVVMLEVIHEYKVPKAVTVIIIIIIM